MKKITIFILLYLFSCVTHGGVYQWTDENGHVHFGSIPPQQQNEYSVGDHIKAAQKKPEQPLEKVVEIKNPIQEKSLGKLSESSQKINSAPLRKVSGKEFEALMIKLRHDAGKVVQRIKDTGPGSQKGVVEDVVTSEDKVPAEIVIDSVTAIEKTETKNETSDGTVANKKGSATVELGSPENVKIVQPVMNKKLETESEERPEVKNKRATVAVKVESITVVLPADEPGEDSGLFGEENSTDENNEIVPEENSDSDKCGLFMGFVEQYKIKRDEGCPGSHCKVYRQQLEKFRMKEKRYCS